MKRKIVLLNAPKGAGKDTIGRCLKNITGCELRAFKTALYECSFPLSRCEKYSEFLEYCNNRDLKEKPSELFYGMSPRGFLIHVSEDVIKPNFGETFFGKKSAQSINVGDFERGVVFTDSGFVEEATPIADKFGRENVYIVQFVGQGSENFEGDSREFIEVSGTKLIKMVHKNEDIIPENFARLILQEINKYGEN